ncbi:hybrid sensor histidine kinase/response regulator transcription factor [Parapedobacter soli]|uniref:hybrid sensor histidine kinase/response regulator transcription factor n=1 Tax=Parapedobacter soli TaxID=416955 RepID=UPI0021C89F3E|nr:hybrid sensor histidine kinase/response regulator transcription factor [Parapedobacter soli]
MASRLCLLIVVFAFHYANSIAQSLFFEHLGVKEGLSQYTIHDIYQDEFEQMWIATNDGLNRYDGNTIETFRPDIATPNGLFGNNIQSVTGNKNGKLFLQCQAGLVAYDLRTQLFTILTKTGVYCQYYGNNRLWIGSENTIRYLDETTNQIELYKTLDSKIQVRTFLELADGSLYIGTNTGVLFLDKNAKVANVIADVFVVCLYEDHMKRIWVGTLEDGLYCIDSKNEVTNYRHIKGDAKSVSSDFIRAICQDDLGSFWIGTFNGLDSFNPETKEFRNYKYSNIDNNSLSDLSIWCIKKDIQGSLWIGTYFGGVNIFNPEFSFNRFFRPMGNSNGPNSAIISKVVEDKEGNLWIGSDYGGVNFYDVEKNTFSYYTQEENANSISSNTIKDLYLDYENDCLWIGSHLGGLDRLDLKTKNIERIAFDAGNRARNNYVRAIAKYQDYLLLATHDAVQKYHIPTGKVKPLLSEKLEFNRGQVWDLLIDKNDCLWFSIHGSIYKYNLRSDKLVPLKEPLTIDRGVFFEDKTGNMWVGSAGNGLFRVDGKTGDIVNFHAQNSELADNYILAIEESSTGYILMTTNNGLSRYEPGKGVFYNYNNNQFFPFTAFNEKSLCVRKNGDIVLSSLSGMMIISDKDLLLTPKPYRINLTSLSINNERVFPAANNELLANSIIVTDELVLKENHSVISIDFAVSNYINALRSEAQYMLIGFDRDWIDAKSYNNITYTNLSSGNYTLKIRSIDPVSGQELASRNLTLVIKPYFYKTWYAYLFYSLAVLGVLYLIYIQLRLRDSLRHADLQSKHAEEMNQSKLRFFVNVSHEIRTPVTLIIAQLDNLINKSTSIPQTAMHKLMGIKRNASNLKNLINELLDFKKQEEPYVPLEIAELDIVKYLNDIFLSFQDYAGSLNINTSFLSTEDSITVYADPAQMNKVFYNLLSNAFKFTPSGGAVSMIIKKMNKAVEITVEDTGVGIKQEHISLIFNRFFKGQDAVSNTHALDLGTGIGLSLVKDIVEQHQGTISVLSNVGKGTVFKVSLPLGSAHFDSNVITTAEAAYHASALPESALYVSGNGTKTSKKSSTIVIVEDNDEMRMLLEEIFTPLYHVVALANGKAAMHRIKEVGPDLVLLDLMLPDIPGIELCRKLKADLATKGIPVVLLTAVAAPEKKIEALQIGADDFVIKPFDTNELIARVNGLINNRIALKDTLVSLGGLNGKVLSVNVQGQQFIERAGDVVLNNLDDPAFGIDKFAAELGISRSSLFTKIKEITGQTPNDFITETRLKKSMRLLDENRHESVANIAFAVGFNDPSYFIRLFKGYFGVTPGQYKAKLN